MPFTDVSLGRLPAPWQQTNQIGTHWQGPPSH